MYLVKRDDKKHVEYIFHKNIVTKDDFTEVKLDRNKKNLNHRSFRRNAFLNDVTIFLALVPYLMVTLLFHDEIVKRGKIKNGAIMF